MKPSNAFEDITEQEFNQREERKHNYQRELMKQMQEAQARKNLEKQKIRDEEMRDELKLRAQLDQLREQYMRETAPKSASTKQRTDQPSRID